MWVPCWNYKGGNAFFLFSNKYLHKICNFKRESELCRLVLLDPYNLQFSFVVSKFSIFVSFSKP